MGYALLIVESLAWSLLLVALVLACAGRLRRGWLRLTLPLPVPLVLLALHFALTAEAAQTQFAFGIGRWFFPMLALTIALLVGTAWLILRGLRRTDADRTTCAAAIWPRGKLAIALAAAVTLYSMTLWNLDLTARQQLAALRVESGAIALSVAPPRIPDRENAAFIYEKAFDAVGDEERHDDSSPGAWIWDEAWTKTWDEIWSEQKVSQKIEIDAHSPTLRRFLARDTSGLNLLRKAATIPGCYIEHDYGRLNLSMTLPELRQFRQGARLLALDAICSAADGNYRQSVADINAIFLMAEHMGSEPLLISEMVAIDIERLGIESLQVVVAKYHIPVEELASLKIPDNAPFRVLLQRGLHGEEALRLAAFDDIGSGRITFSDIANDASLPNWIADPPRSAAYRIFMLSDDLAAHRRFTAETDRAAQAPYWQGRDRLLNLEREIGTNPGGVLTAMLLPAVNTAIERAAGGDARRDVARIGLALYAYRAKNGRFPAKLDDLAPDYIAALPPNPFDGKPMKLTLTEGGVTVDSSPSALPEQAEKSNSINSRNREVKFTVPDLSPAKK